MRKIIAVGLVVGLVSLIWTLVTNMLDQPGRGLGSLKDEYDFIIVGAGTAGSVLARRLSDNGSFSVLLLEAGGTPPWFASVPLAVAFIQQTEWDWKFMTESQTYSFKGFSKQKTLWPMGRCLGGTSSLNYMVHVKGSSSDYDKWRHESDCVSCDYRSLLPYFIKAESVDPGVNALSDSRGDKGPLPVTSVKECHTSKLCQAFLSAFEDEGYSIADLNAGLESGAMPVQHNIKMGKRHTVYDSYLYPAMKNSNLHLATNSLAIQVLTHSTSSFLRAKGVVFRHSEGETYKVLARQEVILSAGVVGSPHLLLLSGIGPRKELETHGIPEVMDLPVGENLQDHLILPIYFQLEEDVATNMQKILRLKTLWDYAVHGTGPLSGTGVEGVARVVLPCLVPWNFTTSTKEQHQSHDDCGRSHLILMLFNLGTIDPQMYTRNTRLKLKSFENLYPGVRNSSNRGFFVLVMLTRPHSKGTVTLHNRDPQLQPIIQPNYLQEEIDVYHLANGIVFMASLTNKTEFKELGVTMQLPDIPGCQNYHRTISEVQYLDCWVRHAAITAYHPSGTCRMGENRLQGTVVDSNMRVHGVQYLRVVDASVFPSPVSGFPHSTVVALAEKAADNILQSVK